MTEHEVASMDGPTMVCTCGLHITAESPWAALMAGSKHAMDMAQ